MATVLSHKERSQRLAALAEQVRSLEALSKDAEGLTGDLMAAGFPANEVATAAAQLLTPLGTLRTNVSSLLSGLSVVHQPVVKVGMPHGYTHAVLTAEDLANSTNADWAVGYGVIRVPAAFEEFISPFSVFVVDDVISVTGSSSRRNDGAYRVRVKPNATPSGEMLSNPSILDATDWTASDGSISFPGPTVDFSASSGTLKQLKADMVTAWTAGEAYLVRINVSAYTGGGISVGTEGTTTQRYINSAGVHEAIVVADSHADGLTITASAATLVISSITMIPWTGLALYEALPQDAAQEDKLVITLSER